MRFSTAAIAVYLGILVLPSFMGCSGKNVNEDDPAALLQEAEEDIESEYYQLAIEKLRKISNKFPYSNYSVKAKLRIADVYFLQESYAEAASAYANFYELHPKHEQVAYAMFRAGESFYNDVPGNIARDLVSATHALDAFQTYLKQFPNDTKSSLARDRAREIKEILAKKELYIGDFYFKRNYNGSARIRYQKLIKLYPETESAHKATDKLKEIENEDSR